MIAAFLRTNDGDFAYGPAIGAFLFFVLTIIEIWILKRALAKRQIPFCFGADGAKIIRIDCGKNPVGFWVVFLIYIAFIVFCVFTIYALCTGFFQRA